MATKQPFKPLKLNRRLIIVGVGQHKIYSSGKASFISESCKNSLLHIFKLPNCASIFIVSACSFMIYLRSIQHFIILTLKNRLYALFLLTTFTPSFCTLKCYCTPTHIYTHTHTHTHTRTYLHAFSFLSVLFPSFI